MNVTTGFHLLLSSCRHRSKKTRGEEGRSLANLSKPARTIQLGRRSSFSLLNCNLFSMPVFDINSSSINSSPQSWSQFQEWRAQCCRFQSPATRNQAQVSLLQTKHEYIFFRWRKNMIDSGYWPDRSCMSSFNHDS